MNIGIDLGTANTLVYVKGKGIVVNEPSVIAVERTTGRILEVGLEAKKMIGKTPANIMAIRPLKDGVIADYNTALTMLKHFINAATGGFVLFKPLVVIGVPTGATEVEKKALIEAAENAGAYKAFLIEEAMATAIGIGLNVEEPSGNMVVDIGGGTTEIAVVSLGSIVLAKSLRIAGDEMDEAIMNYVKTEHNLIIGERTAEEIKINIGNVWPSEEYDNQEMEVIGLDMITGLPKKIKLNGAQIREAISSQIEKIVDQVKLAIEETPPELLSDIVRKGIYLSGGGALLKGLKEKIEHETSIRTIISEDPLTCVARGAGMVLEKISILKKLYRS